MTELDRLKASGSAPDWMTENGFTVLSGGYILPGETPKNMYERTARAAAEHLPKNEGIEQRFLSYMLSGWLCPSTPILSNLGTDRGLPISCYTIDPDDSIDSIYSKVHELAMLSKHGGGVGINVSRIRDRGSLIKNGLNGKSDGKIPFIKSYEQTTMAVSQGTTRRGASAVFDSVDSGDFHDFLNIRRTEGEPLLRAPNIHHGLLLTDEFMHDIQTRKSESQLQKWKEILKTRAETGEPYCVFIDNINRQNPESYIRNSLSVSAMNICTEIVGFTDAMHTFVCDVYSVNAAKWNEWKDNSQFIKDCIAFGDAVMTEFIKRAEGLPGFENAVRFAVKGRMLGMGLLGFHSYLQQEMIPFESLQAKLINQRIFRFLREQSDIATAELAELYGEPEWCRGLKRRNTHCLAVAPTVSNSKISGDRSPSIEPWEFNDFAEQGAKGTVFFRNSELQNLLRTKNRDTADVWESVRKNGGSVQHLDFLSEEQKAVFLTAKEINQFILIKLAADRQKYIDQAQSMNLFFKAGSTAKYISEVHMEAWKSGLKSLYYMRGENAFRNSHAPEYSRSADECAWCEG